MWIERKYSSGLRTAFVCIAALLLSACASVPTAYQPPTVDIASFRPIPSGTMAPRFRIVLHVVNPNAVPLKLRGIAYSVSIEGKEVMTGASNSLPVIDAYGDGDIKLMASANLLNSLELLNAFVSQSRASYHYKFDAKLDPGGGRPVLHVVDEGEAGLKR